MRQTFAKYYSLTKPGVLYGNAITVAAGYFLASRGQVDWWLLAAVFVGSTFVIAAACVLNNYLDQDIDRKMERTKTRILVQGELPGYRAVIFSIVLGVIGISILALWTNWLVVILGLIGFFDYVVLYGMLSKRLSIHGTLVGSISGAIPILAGYCAASGQIDIGAVLAFLIVFFWQEPEFYSIAIYRQREYAAAGIPVMSVVKGVRNTTIQIFIYTIAYVIATLLLTVFGYTGYIYFAVMLLSGGYWIWLGAEGLTAPDPSAWARRMFRFSMVTILIVSVMVSVGPILP